MQRRLAAIFAADIIGYSRLMGIDETGTLERLKRLHKDLVKPQIEGHKGRIFKLMGDGLLAEFSSVVDAVLCADKIQSALIEYEVDLDDSQRLVLRIGINLGDVIVEGADIFGDGVNIAARLESLAPHGGISISGAAFDVVDGKIELNFKDHGIQQLKNIAKPVRIYKANYAKSKLGGADENSIFPVEASIAVLPFANMSGDPEQEYFSDGISEDIITELSRWKSLFVVARNSSFQFRGTSIDVCAVGKQLGVSYILEGSVRKAGSKIRVTAQLIDATTGAHLWAEHYDGTMEDIFELQDDISQTIVTTVTGRIEDIHAARISVSPTKNLTAYEHALRGQSWMHKYTLDAYDKARICFDSAIACDPNFARAHALLAIVKYYEWNLRNYDQAILESAYKAAKTALEFDPHESKSHLALGIIHLFREEHDKAEYHLDRASELNPNDDLIMLETARFRMYTDQPLEGAKLVRLAMRRNPFFPNWYWNILGRCLHTAHIYDEAISTFNRITTPHFLTHTYLAACHAALDQKQEASMHVHQVLQLNPEFLIGDFSKQLPYQNKQVMVEFLAGLRNAGLPD